MEVKLKTAGLETIRKTLEQALADPGFYEFEDNTRIGTKQAIRTISLKIFVTEPEKTEESPVLPV